MLNIKAEAQKSARSKDYGTLPLAYCHKWMEGNPTVLCTLYLCQNASKSEDDYGEAFALAPHCQVDTQN